jgi:hypothetical protein
LHTTAKEFPSAVPRFFEAPVARFLDSWLFFGGSILRDQFPIRAASTNFFVFFLDLASLLFSFSVEGNLANHFTFILELKKSEVTQQPDYFNWE